LVTAVPKSLGQQDAQGLAKYGNDFVTLLDEFQAGTRVALR
jgi:hypothetical protein